MKIAATSILMILTLVLGIISCVADLKSLENRTGKYMAYSKQDTKLQEAKPYGISITKDNGEYYLAAWYDTIDGEKSTGKEKSTVAGGNFQPGEGKLIASLSLSGHSIICQPKKEIYDIIQIGPLLIEWICNQFDKTKLAIFDVILEDAGKRLDKFTQLNSDISRERGIFSFKRLFNSGEVLNISKDDKG
jgi:hypothetical protein